MSDVEAARLYVMDNLNKPGSDSSPQLWLRHGYITRLYREVEEGILCIAENALVETIPEEAKSLKLQGLECYVSFPYQREVYAYVRSSSRRNTTIFSALSSMSRRALQRRRRLDSDTNSSSL